MERVGYVAVVGVNADKLLNLHHIVWGGRRTGGPRCEARGVLPQSDGRPYSGWASVADGRDGRGRGEGRCLVAHWKRPGERCGWGLKAEAAAMQGGRRT